MERIKKEDLEKMYGKLIEERDVSIKGFADKFHFEIYDGLAYCPNHDGHEYVIKFPQLSFIEDSTEMQKIIRERCGLKDTDKISAFETMCCFNEMDEDGVRITYDGSNKAYKPKKLWMAQEY